MARKKDKNKPHFPIFVADYLKARGISEGRAKKFGAQYLTPAEAKAKGHRALPSLGFQHYDQNGNPILDRGKLFIRVRSFPEHATGFDRMIKSDGPKATQPQGTNNHPYLVLGWDWHSIFRDTTEPLVLSESETRAMAAIVHGIKCISFGGVWSWRTKINGISVPLPELSDIECRGRTFLLAFDSDVESNPDVAAALQALAAYLMSRGAEVYSVGLPSAPDGGKQGLDDFLAGCAGNGKKSFDALSRKPVRFLLDPQEPLAAARLFIAAKATAPCGTRTLHYFAGDFYEYDGTAYRLSEENGLRSRAYKFMESASERRGNDVKPYRATKARIDFVIDALKAAAHHDVKLPPPCWTNGRTNPPAAAIVPCKNGLLYAAKRELLGPDPNFFGLNPLEFAFDPRAPAPVVWQRFLKSLWPSDDESICTLQEIFGYLLTNETRYQKIFGIVGPPRSGKGVIGRIITRLRGKASVAGPTLAGLATAFGLQSLLNAPLAIISDAHLGGAADLHVITERLLSISGEDSITVDRKHRDPVTVRLQTRILILTNEVPRFSDESGAIASRFITLSLKRSFLGKEDLALDTKLSNELPSIFLWALDGWDRLRRRGHFIIPKSSKDLTRDLQDLASPIAAFVRDWCECGPSKSCRSEELFGAWKAWCDQQGRTHPGTAATFGRGLRAVYPALGKRHAMADRGREGRMWVYTGIAPRPERVPRERKY